MREGVEVRGEAGPARKPVRTGEHELRVGEHAAAVPAREYARGEFVDLLRRAIDPVSFRAGEQRCYPAIGPCGDCRRARVTGFDEILGQFAILLEAGTWGKR